MIINGKQDGARGGLIQFVQDGGLEFGNMAKKRDAISRKGYRAGLEVWREKYLPGHFGRGAASRYSYQARSEKYTEQKRKYFGTEDPLVKEGYRRTTQKGTGEPTLIHAAVHGDFKYRKARGGDGLDLVLKLPQHAYYYKKRKSGGTSPKMTDELSTILDVESDEMTETAAEVILEGYLAEADRGNRRVQRAIRKRAVERGRYGTQV